jgi:hypothetical protein
MFVHLNARDQKWLRAVCGVVAGLVLAFSGIVWDKAVIADIWPLSLLIFASVLCLFMRWMFEPERRRFLYAGFFLFGLLLTNSQELIVALPGLIGSIMLVDRNLGRDVALMVLPLATIVTAWNQYAVWIVFPTMLNWPLLLAFVITGLAGVGLAVVTKHVGTEWKAVLLCEFLLLCGLAFYLYVPIASMMNPPMNWGYPRTLEGFWHVISRGQYERLHPASFGAPERFAVQVWNFLWQTEKGFGCLYLVLSVLPFCFLRRMSRPGQLLMLGFLAVWIGVAPLLVAELNPPSDRAGLELTEQYFAASYCLLAVWLGLALVIVGANMTKPSKASG